MILGTAAYMSPEQARGKALDKRADIWAFGAVLFEMLSARRAFGGEDVAETLANVINKEPDWTVLPPALPAHIGQALRLCLRKDPKQRVGDIRDVRLALDGAFETAAPQSTPAPIPSSRGRWPWIAFAVATLVAVALTVPAVRYLRQTPAPPPPEMRVDIVTPATDRPSDFALSPDGRQIVFVASEDGESRLWVRPLGATTTQPLAGTEGANFPFWSPDSRSIGFFAGETLKRLDLVGGPPQTLAPAQSNAGSGGTWNGDGVIVFTSGIGPLMRVSASGGASRWRRRRLARGRRATSSRSSCPTASGSCSGRTVRRTRPGRTWARSTVAPLRGSLTPDEPRRCLCPRGGCCGRGKGRRRWSPSGWTSTRLRLSANR
jgi:hypothetical protein